VGVPKSNKLTLTGFQPWEALSKRNCPEAEGARDHGATDGGHNREMPSLAKKITRRKTSDLVGYLKTLHNAISRLCVTLAEKSIECANELGGDAFAGSRRDAYSLLGATIRLDVEVNSWRAAFRRRFRMS
jgi:hypothetical protein